MDRRTLLGGIFAAAVATVLTGRGTAACAAPQRAAAGEGTLTVHLWGKWTPLPGTGLEVHCTAANGRTAGVPVRWTAAGAVTADYPNRPITVTAPTVTGVQHVASSGPYGLAVRRS